MLPQQLASGNLQGGSGAPFLQNAGGANVNQIVRARSGGGSPISPVRAAPAITPSYTYTTGTSAGGGGTATDPNAIAYYGDVINQLVRQLHSAQGQQKTGLGNITNAFNQSRNELNQQESAAETGYNTQRGQTGQSRESNIGTINTGANQAYNSLLSLLGASGAGVSSVARVGAPQAVAQNASQQRGQANETYNTNLNSINTAEGQTKQQYQNAVRDLLTQKASATQDYLSNLLGQEANLEQQIGAAKINRAEYGGQSYAQAERGASNENKAVNSIEGQLNRLFTKYATPKFNVSPVQATTPKLNTYSYDPTTVKAQAANPGTDSSFLPYLASLKPDQNNVLTGSAAAKGATAITAGK